MADEFDDDPYLVPKKRGDDPNRMALADPRVKDFLGKISKSEGADYNTLVGGSRINNLSRHPNKVGLRTSAGPSTAFGRYQITGTTNRTKLRKYADLDYSPENQDLRAVELLRQTKALDALQADDPDTAVRRAGKEWASLPGSPLPGRKRPDVFRSQPQTQDPYLIPKAQTQVKSAQPIETTDDPYLIANPVAQPAPPPVRQRPTREPGVVGVAPGGAAGMAAYDRATKVPETIVAEGGYSQTAPGQPGTPVIRGQRMRAVPRVASEGVLEGAAGWTQSLATLSEFLPDIMGQGSSTVAAIGHAMSTGKWNPVAEKLQETTNALREKAQQVDTDPATGKPFRDAMSYWQSVPLDVLQAGVKSGFDIPRYVLMTRAVGPIMGFGIEGALSAPPDDRAKGLVAGTAMGAAFKGLETIKPLTRTLPRRIGSFGALGAGQTAAEQEITTGEVDPRAVMSSAITMGGLGAIGGRRARQAKTEPDVTVRREAARLAAEAEPVQVKEGEVVRPATEADLPKVAAREIEVVPPVVEEARRRISERVPQPPEPSTPWLEDLFAEQSGTPTPMSRATNPLQALVQGLRTHAEASRANAADWASRVYKGNDKGIELQGDGPTRHEVISVSQANESRRNRNVEMHTGQAEQASRVAAQIESGQLTPETLFPRIAEWEKNIREIGSGDVDSRLTQAIASGLLRTNQIGEGSVAAKILQAYRDAATVPQSRHEEPAEPATPVSPEKSASELPGEAATTRGATTASLPTENVASEPLTITRGMAAGLKERGYSQGVIDKLTSQQARDLLASLEPASWVIKNKTTGEVVMETFDKKKVAALNTEKYEAVPIEKYLQSLNEPSQPSPQREVAAQPASAETTEGKLISRSEVIPPSTVSPERPIVLRQADSDKGGIVAPSPTDPKMWRVTRFDSQGFSGHGEYRSREEALRDAKEAFRFTKPMSEREFADITSTEKFAAGNELSEFVNKRDLTPEDQRRIAELNQKITTKPEPPSGLPLETVEQHKAPFKGVTYDFGYGDTSQGSPKALAALRSWDTPRLEKERYEMFRAESNRMFGQNAKAARKLIDKVLEERKTIEASTVSPERSTRAERASDVGAELREVKPANLEGISDTSVVNAEGLGNLAKGLASGKSKFSDLEIPAQRAVVGDVISVLHNPQVREAVIKFVPVDVVDGLINGKLSPEMLLHDKSVLHNAPSLNAKGSIPLIRDKADSLVRAAAQVITENPSSFEFGRGPAKDRTAMVTGSGHAESIPQPWERSGTEKQQPVPSAPKSRLPTRAKSDDTAQSFATIGEYEFAIVKSNLPDRPDMHMVGMRRAGSTGEFESAGVGHRTSVESLIERWTERELKRGEKPQFQNEAVKTVWGTEKARIEKVEAEREADATRNRAEESALRARQQEYDARVEATPLPTGKKQKIKINTPEGMREASEDATVYGDWAIRKDPSKYARNPYNVTHLPSGMTAGQVGSIGQAKNLVKAFLESGVNTTSSKLAKDKTAMKQLAEIHRYITTSGGAEPPSPKTASSKPPLVAVERQAKRGEAGKSVTRFTEGIEERHSGIPFARRLFGARQPADTLKAPSSISAEVEQRMKAAEGVQPPSVLSRTREAVSGIYHSFKRTYPEINPNKDDVSAVVNDIFRQHEATPAYAKAQAFNRIAEITENLGKERLKVFSRNLQLPDILKDIEAGKYADKPLPFGYKSKSEVESDLAQFKAVADSTPAIKDALKRREEFASDLTQRLVDLELLPKEVLNDSRYYHRQVMEYVNNPTWVGTGHDIRMHRKGFQKSRTGGGDFNTRYQEAEFEWAAQAISLIRRKETLEAIKRVADIKPDLSEQAAVWNEANPRNQKTWQDFLPETHAIWQPTKGNHFYPALTVAERTIDKILLGTRDFERADVREVIALGGKREQWVVPKEIAKTLDDFKPVRDEGPVENFWTQMQSSWKQWTLLSPARAIKYNVNNISGDLDIALAYSPRILGNYKTSAQDLWNYQVNNRASRPARAEIEDAIKRGVVDSGLTITEIPDINKTGAFRALTSTEPNLIRKGVQSYWGGVKTFTSWRENTLRLAAFRHFKSELAKEKTVYGASNKGQIDALLKSEGTDATAAKLARELIGDYGAVSTAGQWIRRHLIPFYSWIEINAPRYARLMHNLPHEGKSPIRGLAGATVKVGSKGVGLAVKANILFLTAQLWNHTMFPEEEKELRRDRRENHLILGRNEDGSIRRIRVEGALADALEWFGLNDYPYDIADLVTGRKTVKAQAAEALKAPPTKIVQSLEPVAKTTFETATGRTTFPTLFEEGESFRLRTRPIRDRKEYVARVVGLDGLYRRVTGRPRPPTSAGSIADMVLTQRTDPGEAAYWEMRGKAMDWAKKQGREFSGGEPTERSNALYYFRQATKWKDEKATKKWLAEYQRLGGTDKGMAQSLRVNHPLGMLKRDDHETFTDSLSADDKAALEYSVKWYRSTYGEIPKGRPSRPSRPDRPPRAEMQQ